MMILLSIAASVLPMLIGLYLLWRFNNYDLVSKKNVLFHFIYGATIAIFLGIIGSKALFFLLAPLFSDELNTLLKVIMIAPIVEELAKASLLFVTLYNRSNSLTDGVLYGAAIGLGFGMTENFLYFIVYSDSLATFIPLVLTRTLFSAVMHAVATASVGGIMCVAKNISNNKFLILTVAGLILAIFIHFIWNFSVSFFWSI